jgi:hypothetical protein
VTLIASNENIAAKDRIDAEAASCEVAVAIVKLAFDGPIALKDFAHAVTPAQIELIFKATNTH